MLKRFNTDYSILRNRDFLFVSLTRSFSVQAKLIRTTVMGWFIYETTHDPFNLGYLALCEAIPFMCLTTFSGYIADQYGRRKPMMIQVTILFFLALMMCYLVTQKFTPAILIGIYTCTTLFGLTRGMGGGILQSLIALIVPRKDIQKATVWDGIFMQISLVTSPILGGVVYNYFGIVAAIGLVVLLPLISFIMIFFIRDVIIPEDEVSTKIESQWHKLTAGFRFIFSHQMLQATVLLDFFAVILSGVTGLLPVFAKDVLHLGPDGLGYLRASISVGSLSAGIFLAHYHLRGFVGRQFLGATGAFCFCLLLFSQSNLLPLSMLMLFLSGAFDWYATMIRGSIMRLITPDRIQGRVTAARIFFANSANEINSFQSAMLTGMIGAVPAVMTGGFLTLVIVFLTAWKATQLRSITMERLIEKND